MDDGSVDEDRLADILRHHDLRVTQPRLAVLCCLESSGHATAEQVADGVRELIGPVATQTIYDVLAVLTSAGLVRTIEPAGSARLYERRVGDNHHHIICRRCRMVADIDCATGHVPCLEIPAPHAPVGGRADSGGFLIDEAEVIFWGLCSTCRSDEAEIAPPSAMLKAA
ncbi:MAG: transcriptional repressor [Propionibacteriaceae bacterium]|jgi:Fur family ferric uptake transcriptional regulator|nr:transcriptional repressor [Propionibacteriaceae bacterium]